MRRCFHLLILTLVSILGTSNLARAEGEKKKLKFPDWAFCVAYTIRDADKRDERPRNPGDEDPFDRGATTVPRGSLIRPGHIVDVASLISRSLAQKQLSRDATLKVVSAILEPRAKHPMMDCYEPHHIFVFYSYSGAPVACIEVCLSCSRVKQDPHVKETRDSEWLYETADLVSLARILSDAGLPLNPYKSIEEYEERVRSLSERETKRAEPQR